MLNLPTPDSKSGFDERLNDGVDESWWFNANWRVYPPIALVDWPLYGTPPNEEQLGEAYRRCCTSVSWVGEALTIHLMGVENVWNHPAFFDYVDRWMSEDDTKAVAEIYA